MVLFRVQLSLQMKTTFLQLVIKQRSINSICVCKSVFQELQTKANSVQPILLSHQTELCSLLAQKWVQLTSII